MKNHLLCWLSAFLLAFASSITVTSQVGLYRTFERSIENNNPYSNKFDDVELTCVYTSPTGRNVEFYGFYDGDGQGGGDSATGNIWKIRFLPDEPGEWHYEWTWSDTTNGGSDKFLCEPDNAGKGVLRPYEENPRWLAYNGTDPVWLKSYYESGHGAISQPFEWITENVYQPMLDRGYNHFQVNWLLSLCCYSQFYNDGPSQSTQDLTLYQSGKASSTMRLDVWKLMEQNIEWLNDRNVGLHMFLGFDGGKNGGPDWAALSEYEKEYYVKYVVARLAPYANIAGWSFVWEVPGDRTTHELGWAGLVQKYDVFDHLRTYQDEKPITHEYERPEYNFAAIENHSMYSEVRDEERQYWKEPWTHHYACLKGYVPGKPVYMIEGNALWRRYWAAKCGATKDDLRRSAWGCAVAGASFNWCGHEGVGPLKAYGDQGLPFHGDVNEYATSALQLDILERVVTEDVEFFRMTPADSLLFDQDTLAVWCLAEPGEQYLVFTIEGKSFSLQLAAGEYLNNHWINTMTGAGFEVPAFTASEGEKVSFTPPDTNTDWALVIKSTGDDTLLEEAEVIIAETDTSGGLIYISCSHDIRVPEDYNYGFSIKKKGSSEKYDFTLAMTDDANPGTLILLMEDSVYVDDEIELNYLGTLATENGNVLAPVSALDIINNSTKTIPDIGKVVLRRTAEIKVYPNPSTDELEVASDYPIDSIEIFTVSGRSVYKKKEVNQFTAHLPLRNMEAGNYIVTITTEVGTAAVNFIKN